MVLTVDLNGYTLNRFYSQKIEHAGGILGKRSVNFGSVFGIRMAGLAVTEPSGADWEGWIWSGAGDRRQKVLNGP